jgi:hypothetical protein
MQEETVSISVLVKAMPAQEQSQMVACVRILQSMYMDYHDTKAHPQMSLNEHIESCQLSQQDADSVRTCLKPIGYRGSELIAAGVPQWLLKRLGIIRRDGTVDAEHLEWPAAEITCGGRSLACLVAFLYVLDLNDADTVYSA